MSEALRLGSKPCPASLRVMPPPDSSQPPEAG